MAADRRRTAYAILISITAGHLINDMVQALLPALYPMLKTAYALSFLQIGLLTFTSHVTASVLQPVVGFYTDRRPQPYSLAAAMGITLVGLLLLAWAHSYPMLVGSAALVGVGSSIFHPESSRVARMASGGRHGLAQSLFQTGGNAGSSLGPLLAAVVVLPRGQTSTAWFSVAVIMGIALLWRVGTWYRAAARTPSATAVTGGGHPGLSRAQVRRSVAVLLALVFSKYIYLVSLTTYFTFYLIHHFGVTVGRAQLHLFGFLVAVAAGTFIGGPVGDRVGRKAVIWVSILGVLPFTLALPYVNLFWTGVLSLVIGFVLASAFSAIVVFAHELLPGRIGLVSGLFFGFAFGAAGVGAAALGRFADATSIELMYRVCAFLPALGVLTVLLPDLRPHRHAL